MPKWLIYFIRIQVAHQVGMLGSAFCVWRYYQPHPWLWWEVIDAYINAPLALAIAFFPHFWLNARSFRKARRFCLDSPRLASRLYRQTVGRAARAIETALAG